MFEKPFWRKRISSKDIADNSVDDTEVNNITSEDELDNSKEDNISPVTLKTQEKINTLIEDTPLQKIKYMIMELLRKELWISIHWSRHLYEKEIIETWLPLKDDITIESIILNILSSNPWVEYKDEYLIIWWITLGIINDHKWISFSLQVEKDNTNNIKLLKDIIKSSVTGKLKLPNTQLSLNDISDNLWIDTDNIIHNQASELSLWFSACSEINLQDDSTYKLLLSKFWNDYFINFWYSCTYALNNSLEFDVLVTSMFSNNSKNKYSIKIDTTSDQLIFTIKNSWSVIEKDFLINFVKPLIFEIKSLEKNKKNNIGILESYWVSIDINSWENKSLEEISEEEWFIWYEEVKEEIDTKIINPWKNKEVFLKKASENFPNIKNIIPNYVIFEWSPWTWKTTEAKIIWKYLWYPFIYIPINSITSKWYWESESKLNNIFELSWEIAKEHWGAILMIDEIDEIWANRDTSHEATWRITWVLLKKLDGFEKIDNILLLASTNRLKDLDPALVSRSNLTLNFKNPNKSEINAILNHYINNLWEMSDSNLSLLEWKSWRDLNNLAKDFISHLLKTQMNWDFNNTEFLNSEFDIFLKKYPVI